MKKCLMLLLVMTMVVSMFVGIQIVSADDDISVYLNGNRLDFDVPPMLIDDRTMVPMRKIFESFGVNVDWNEKTKTITVKKSIAEGQYSYITMTIGDNKLIKDNEEIIIDVAPVVIDNRTLVPVRAVSEALNAEVQWSAKNNAVVITNGSLHVYADYPQIPDIGDYNDFVYVKNYEKDGITVFEYIATVDAIETMNIDEWLEDLANMNLCVYDGDFDNSKQLLLVYDSAENPTYIMRFYVERAADNYNHGVLRFEFEDDLKQIYNKSGNIKTVGASEVGFYINAGWLESMPFVGNEMWMCDRDILDKIDISMDDYLELKTWNKVYFLDFERPKNIVNSKINNIYISINDKQYTMPYNEFFMENDLYSESPQKIFEIPDNEWNEIQRGKIWIGMESFYLMLIKGYPDDINKTVTASTKFEQWVYRSYDGKATYYYFENDILTGWQE